MTPSHHTYSSMNETHGFTNFNNKNSSLEYLIFLISASPQKRSEFKHYTQASGNHKTSLEAFIGQKREASQEVLWSRMHLNQVVVSISTQVFQLNRKKNVINKAFLLIDQKRCL